MIDIFYHERSNLNLKSFGIQIPLNDSRANQVYQSLSQIDPNQECFKIRNDFIDVMPVDKNVLGLAYNDDFLKPLLSNSTEADKMVSDCFELIATNGTYHRYEPTENTRPLRELVQKFILQTQGSLACMDSALKNGFSYYLGGGFHHGMSFGGRGFCLINDIVVAARWAQKNRNVGHVWVIDTDAHKGDGTAELTVKDSSITTLSIHMADGWPLDSDRLDPAGKLNPWFIDSTLDIGIRAGEESTYLKKLSGGLDWLEQNNPAPDLVIVVQGSDPYEKDQLPSANLLKLTKAQMFERDRIVYDFFKKRKTPQAYLMCGGYGDFVHEIYTQFLESVFRESSQRRNS